MNRILVNNQIRAREVRLIDENDKQIGVVSLEEAIRLARERNLDLIQVTEKVEPPVCKIGDFGKYLYREEKKNKLAKKQRGGELKGIRLSFNISPHDMETKANQAVGFLEKGNKVKIELRLYGRQKAFSNMAREKINIFIENLKNKLPIKVERDIKREFGGLTTIISKG